MTVENALQTAFCSNFVAYYRTHQAHANVTGRNFFSDHKLLGEIYEHLQDEIDTLGELLRTLKVSMPATLGEIIMYSEVEDKRTYDYLYDVTEDLEKLIEVYETLMEASDKNGYKHISNYAQEQVKTFHKFVWMLEATTGKEYE